MATLTSAVGSISSAGIGSGLDVNNIVTSLMNVERQPLGRLQSAATTLQTKLSAFGQLKSVTSALQDAASALLSGATYTASTASSSDTTSITASSNAKAALGSYSVSVSALSASQSLVSPVGQYVDGTSVVGTGSITLRLGTWSGTAFTGKPGAADVVIPIGAGESTLAGIRDKINAANAGVSASIVTDTSGARLALQSSAGGAANGFQVTVSDDDLGNADASGLSRLAYDPSTGASRLNLAQAASDLRATVNGIDVTSASNTLDNVIEGITFNLSKVTSQPVTISVSRSTEELKGKVASFVAAYNTLNSFLSSVTNYDAAKKQGALLQGDGTTTGMQNQLRSLLGQPGVASAAFTTLSSIGVRAQKDGSLKLDDAAFSTALTNLPELTKALSLVDPATPGNNGFAKRFSDWTGKLLASNGTISGKTTALQAQIKSNEKTQTTLTSRLEMVEQRLRAQYSTLDTTMSRANALNQYITQQFYTLPKASQNS